MSGLKISIFEGFRTYNFQGEGNKQVEGAKQEAWLHVPGQRFPVRCDISLQKGVPPLRPGDYMLGPTSYAVKDGALVVKPKAADLQALEGSRAQAPRAATAG